MDLVSILVVTIVTLIGIAAALYGHGMSHLKEIKQNWVQYRCNPIYMPLAGMVGSDIMTNFTHCTMQSIQSYAGFVVDPIFQSFQDLQEIFGYLLTSIQFIRQKMAGTVDGFLGIITSVFGKVQNTVSVILQQVGRVRTIMNRIISVFVVMLHVATTGLHSGMSIKNGPIGQTAEFLCFDPATPITMEDGTTTPISEILPYDVLSGGTIVTSILQLDGRETAMVSLYDIVVSRNHKILYMDSWIRCGDHPDAVDHPSVPIMYCLNTSNHTIPIDGMLFKDYEETDDVHEFYDDVMRFYGQNKVPPLRVQYPTTGFSEATPIRMEGGTFAYYDDIALGDRVLQGGRVIGKISHIRSTEFATVRGIPLMPGTMVFRLDGTLYTAINGFDDTPELDPNGLCVQLITEHAKVVLANGSMSVTILDDQEVPDPTIHEKRDAKVMEA